MVIFHQKTDNDYPRRAMHIKRLSFRNQWIAFTNELRKSGISQWTSFLIRLFWNQRMIKLFSSVTCCWSHLIKNSLQHSRHGRLPGDAVNFSVEFLNSLSPSGFPYHRIILKNIKDNQCFWGTSSCQNSSGTRFHDKTIYKNVIKVIILTACAQGETVCWGFLLILRGQIST